MTVATSTPWFFIAAAIFALFAATGVAGMHLAAQLLRTSVEHALGPEIRFDSLRVGLTDLEITGVEVRAPQGWPTLNMLSAKRVVVVPDLRDLMSGQVVIDRVIFEHAFISALRTNEDGTMRVLPGILEQPGTIVAGGPSANRPSHGAVIGSVELRDCTIDLYNSTGPDAKKTRIDSVSVVIENVEVPNLTDETMLNLKGLITRADHRATFALQGWGGMANPGPETDRNVRRIDGPSFRPYY